MYFIFYLIFPFLYIVCRLYIRISFYHCYFFILCLLVLGSMIISGIINNPLWRDPFHISIFYFVCVVCDHWLYVIIIIIDLWLSFFSFLCVCFGLWVYNPCDMGIIYIIELGFIYSISFLFVFFGMSVRDSFIILEVWWALI